MAKVNVKSNFNKLPRMGTLRNPHIRRIYVALAEKKRLDALIAATPIPTP